MALDFGEVESVAIELIDLSEDFQTRLETDGEFDAQYARDLEAGHQLPPPKLVKVGIDCYLPADGIHTIGAYQPVDFPSRRLRDGARLRAG